MNILSNNWSFFDKIVCINLVTRDDRLEKMKLLFEQLQIPITFYRAEKNPNGGTQGCFESHVNVIKQAYDEGCDNCLIFEDDIEITDALSYKSLNRCINFMESDQNWDLFYLGIYPDLGLNRIKYISEYIIQLHTFNTHAYVVSRKFMEKMRFQTFVGVPIDSLYLYNTNSYSYYRSLFIQDQMNSDIEHSNLGAPWLRKKLAYATEMYAYYYNVPSIITGVFLFALLFLIFMIRPVDWYLWFPFISLSVFSLIVICNMR